MGVAAPQATVGAGWLGSTILSKVWSSVLVYWATAIARKQVSQKSSLKIYLLLHFLSNHPETFRICPRDHLEDICRAEF